MTSRSILRSSNETFPMQKGMWTASDDIPGETLQQTTTDPQYLLVWWNSDITNNNENVQQILKNLPDLNMSQESTIIFVTILPENEYSS
jgi:hypothetical protein